MPELPEVETQCRYLRCAHITDQKIVEVSVLWERTLGGMSTDEFTARLIGLTMVDVRRRGKYIHIRLSDGSSLLIHLRMTGSLVVREAFSAPDKHDRVIINLGKMELVFHDPRKFGRVILTDTPQVILGKLGPEPLDEPLTEGQFHQLITGKNRMLKALLLDQSVLAGLGNIYVDESLFASGLHPRRLSGSLSRVETDKLLTAIRFVLESGIRNRGTSLGDGDGNFTTDGSYGDNAGSLQVFRRTGLPCLVCGTTIERIIVAQRSTHLCPACQPED